MRVNDFVILLVEDDPTQILLFKAACERAHLVNPVHIVIDGEKAIWYLSGEGEYSDRQKHPLPSLILLDLKLPRKSGIEVLEWLRQHPPLKHLPVVILTNSVDPRDVKRVTELGVSAYLGKPVDFVGLLEMMKTVGMYWMILHKNPASSEALPPPQAGQTTTSNAGVLLLDQDQDSLEGMAQSLGRRLPGVGIDACLSPDAALKLLASRTYRVLVLDHETSLEKDPDFLGKVLTLRKSLPIVLLVAPETDLPKQEVRAVLEKNSRFGLLCEQLQKTITDLFGHEEALQAPSIAPAPAPRDRVPRQDTEILGEAVHFKKTSWDLVRAARDVQALDSLIRIYWKPLYFFVRQRGNDNETAKDIVQEFLTSALERGTILKADPARGKFRTFLLSALEHFMVDRARTAGRLKRGGGQAFLSLDFDQGEKEFAFQATSGVSPEAIMDQTWAKSLLHQSIAELKGQPSHLRAFELLMEGADYKTITAETSLTSQAAKTAIYRLRVQLKDILTGHLTREGSPEEDVTRSVSDFLALLTGAEDPPESQGLSPLG